MMAALSFALIRNFISVCFWLVLLSVFRVVRKDEAGAHDTPARAMVQHAGEKGKRNQEDFFRFLRRIG